VATRHPFGPTQNTLHNNTGHNFHPFLLGPCFLFPIKKKKKKKKNPKKKKKHHNPFFCPHGGGHTTSFFEDPPTKHQTTRVGKKAPGGRKNERGGGWFRLKIFPPKLGQFCGPSPSVVSSVVGSFSFTFHSLYIFLTLWSRADTKSGKILYKICGTTLLEFWKRKRRSL